MIPFCLIWLSHCSTVSLPKTQTQSHPSAVHKLTGLTGKSPNSAKWHSSPSGIWHYYLPNNLSFQDRPLPLILKTFFIMEELGTPLAAGFPTSLLNAILNLLCSLYLLSSSSPCWRGSCTEILDLFFIYSHSLGDSIPIDQEQKILFYNILFLEVFIQYLPFARHILRILHTLSYLIFISTLWKKKQTPKG